MKKLLFRNFIKNTLNFFIIMCLSISLIVWVIQAVGFLDFVTEDGHGLYVYFLYSFLNFPKMVSRILPFVFFISLFYQLSQYELRNELLIFWSNGITKLSFVNVIISYSLIIFLLQLFLGGYVSPLGQNEARSLLRNSNIDFFPSLIKEGKFIDTVSNLTIFIQSKDNFGNYDNIFLKEDIVNTGLNESQIIYAKKGFLVNEKTNRYFKLRDGEIVNNKEGKITKFSFESIDFNLIKYISKSTTYPKIQGTSSEALYRCLLYYFKLNLKKFKHEYLNCNETSIKPISQEFLKRFYKPLYIPLIALVGSLLLIRSKESRDYTKYKLFLFLITFLIIVFSEIMLRYSTESLTGLLFFTIFPLLTFSLIYIFLLTLFNRKA